MLRDPPRQGPRGGQRGLRPLPLLFLLQRLLLGVAEAVEGIHPWGLRGWCQQLRTSSPHQVWGTKLYNCRQQKHSHLVHLLTLYHLPHHNMSP